MPFRSSQPLPCSRAYSPLDLPGTVSAPQRHSGTLLLLQATTLHYTLVSGTAPPRRWGVLHSRIPLPTHIFLPVNLRLVTHLKHLKPTLQWGSAGPSYLQTLRVYEQHTDFLLESTRFLDHILFGPTRERTLFEGLLWAAFLCAQTPSPCFTDPYWSLPPDKMEEGSLALYLSAACCKLEHPRPARICSFATVIPFLPSFLQLSCLSGPSFRSALLLPRLLTLLFHHCAWTPHQPPPSDCASSVAFSLSPSLSPARRYFGSFFSSILHFHVLVSCAVGFPICPHPSPPACRCLPYDLNAGPYPFCSLVSVD